MLRGGVSFACSPDGLTGALSFAVNVSVVNPPFAPFLAMIMTAAGSGTAEVTIVNRNESASTIKQVIVGNFTDLTMNMSLVWSFVPMVNISGLNPLVNKIVTMFILPMINEALQHGLPLPSAGGVSFVNTHVLYDEGFVAVLAAINGTLADATGFAGATETMHRPVGG